MKRKSLIDPTAASLLAMFGPPIDHEPQARGRQWKCVCGHINRGSWSRCVACEVDRPTKGAPQDG
jgi:hypothetical protein